MTPVTVSTSELPEATAKLEIEVSPDAVESALEHAAEHMAGEIKIPGFRQGKVPPELARQKIGDAAIFEHAFDESVGGWYGEALDQADIAPIGSPSLDGVPSWTKGEALKFELTVPVRPVAEVGDYEGIEVGKKDAEPDLSVIDGELATMQDRFSKLEDVDRPAQGGDFVDINFLGKLGDEPFEGGAGNDYVLELGSGQFIPGFEEQLTGAKAGEDTIVNVTFPDEYGAEHLAGKEANFDVHINSVKEKSLPELNDEFASENLGFDTLQEAKDDIAARVAEAAEKEVEQEYRWAVVDAVAKQAKIEIPHGHIHSRAHELWHELANSLYRRGIDPNAYLQAMGQSEHDFIDSAEGDAEQTIRREATIAALIEKQGIEISEDEMVDAIAEDMGEGRDSAEEQFAAIKEAGGIKQLENELKARKVIDELVSKATPIPWEQAEAREAIWTPEKEEAEGGEKPAEGLWTPGS
ncbi:MAG: trigger factor [Solirubrobacterales bacterium]|nr:trigger factor [Solirubrobacterales bacterium]